MADEPQIVLNPAPTDSVVESAPVITTATDLPVDSIVVAPAVDTVIPALVTAPEGLPSETVANPEPVVESEDAITNESTTIENKDPVVVAQAEDTTSATFVNPDPVVTMGVSSVDGTTHAPVDEGTANGLLTMASRAAEAGDDSLKQEYIDKAMKLVKEVAKPSKSPSDWNITANKDDDGINAINVATSETYIGDIAGFNALMKE
jgi:hypothetical protein